ncbi:MAG: ABC transporter permease subunit [Candidatus Thorarchaeota archaeon]
MRSLTENDHVREFIRLARFDTEVSYRSPVIELLVAIVVFVAGAGALRATMGMTVSSRIQAIPFYNATQTCEMFTQGVEMQLTMGLILALYNVWYTMVLLIPPIVAFTFARRFEDGTMRTFLSYPIDRRQLIVTKMIVLFLVVWIPGVIISVTWIYLPFLGIVDWAGIVLTIAVATVALMLLVTGTFAIAAVTRKSATTTVVAMMMWIVLLITFSSQGTIPPFMAIGNPMNLVLEFLMGGTNAPHLGDVILGLVVDAMLATLAGVVAIKAFDMAEVA